MNRPQRVVVVFRRGAEGTWRSAGKGENGRKLRSENFSISIQNCNSQWRFSREFTGDCQGTLRFAFLRCSESFHIFSRSTNNNEQPIILKFEPNHNKILSVIILVSLSYRFRPIFRESDFFVVDFAVPMSSSKVSASSSRDGAKKAQGRISKQLLRTPLLQSEYFTSLVDSVSSSSTTSTTRVLLKLESEQVTGSFKARGAYNAILSLVEECKAKNKSLPSSCVVGTDMVLFQHLWNNMSHD